MKKRWWEFLILPRPLAGSGQPCGTVVGCLLLGLVATSSACTNILGLDDPYEARGGQDGVTDASTEETAQDGSDANRAGDGGDSANVGGQGGHGGRDNTAGHAGESGAAGKGGAGGWTDAGAGTGGAAGSGANGGHGGHAGTSSGGSGGSGGQGGGEPEPECGADSKDCVAPNTPRVCIDGQWKAQDPCKDPTPVCASGGCVPVCENGKMDCLDKTPRLCARNAWLNQSSCSGAKPFCALGQCVECAEGTPGCDGDTPRICLSGQWKLLSPCSAPTPRCGAGACFECINGSGRCVGNTPGVCINDHWEDHAACGKSSTCLNGDCVVCQNHTANCDEDPQNGCETDLVTVVYSGTSCTSCPAGYGNCNLDSNDGCETDLASSLDHCGSCGKKASKVCHPDGDGDGYGTPAEAVTVCTSCSAGWLENKTDCDDVNPEAHPWQTRYWGAIPDGTTNWDLDCDGEISCVAYKYLATWVDGHDSIKEFVPDEPAFCTEASQCTQNLEIYWSGPDGQYNGYASVYRCELDDYGDCHRKCYSRESCMESWRESWGVFCK